MVLEPAMPVALGDPLGGVVERLEHRSRQRRVSTDDLHGWASSMTSSRPEELEQPLAGDELAGERVLGFRVHQPLLGGHQGGEAGVGPVDAVEADQR